MNSIAFESKFEEGTINWLNDLQVSVDALIQDARDIHEAAGIDSPFHDDAIDWTSVQCPRTLYSTDNNGESETEAVIMNATVGDSPGLRRHLANKLRELGYGDVLFTEPHGSWN